jgi:hypothetical protein
MTLLCGHIYICVGRRYIKTKNGTKLNILLEIKDDLCPVGGMSVNKYRASCMTYANTKISQCRFFLPLMGN